MIIKVINKSNFELPEYKTRNSAGLDLRANISENIILKPFERIRISTGLYIEPICNELCEAQIRSRSGLAYNYGIICIDTPATIDMDYRGELHVALINLSQSDFTITPGMRIAQLVFNKIEKIKWKSVNELSQTERGDNGFGSTGLS